MAKAKTFANIKSNPGGLLSAVNNSGIGESLAHIPTPKVEVQEQIPTKGKRKKSVRDERPHQMSFRIDDALREQMDLIKFKNKVETQDVVFAALKYFMENFCSENGLTPNGVGELEKWTKR